jgi:quercetin dioxygenase-like cupin family protein
MTTGKGNPNTGQETRLQGIVQRPFRLVLGDLGGGSVKRSRSIRPVSPLIATLAVLATVLGVIGLVAPVGSVQATPPTGTTLENLGRATLGPFRIVLESETDPLSADTADVTMHKVTMDVDGNSGWHIHPGLTFGIVRQGQVEFTRLTKDGCVTQAFGPGEGFVEPANEVHIARNTGDEPLVIYLTRLNIPVGGASTDSSPAEPDCNLASGRTSGRPSFINPIEVTANASKLELDALDEGQQFSQYDLEIQRLEGEISALLAEARQESTTNSSQLDRESRRLDYQIDMLRLADMQR